MGLSLAIVIGFSLANEPECTDRAGCLPLRSNTPGDSNPGYCLAHRVLVWLRDDRTGDCLRDHCLVPNHVNTLFGLQAAPRGLHDLFTLQQVDRMTRRLRKLMFPAALPAIFAGLRIRISADFPLSTQSLAISSLAAATPTSASFSNCMQTGLWESNSSPLSSCRPSWV